MVDVAAMRADLLRARKARDSRTERALKRCLAAIENAEAPPAQQRVNVLGETGPTEVPRLVLTAADLAAVLRAEIAEAAVAADQYAAGGRHEEAARLRAESAVIATYLAT